MNEQAWRQEGRDRSGGSGLSDEDDRGGPMVSVGGRDRRRRRLGIRYGDGAGVIVAVVAVLAAFGLAAVAVVAGMPAEGAAALLIAAAAAATQVLQQVRQGWRGRPGARRSGGDNDAGDDLDDGTEVGGDAAEPGGGAGR